MKVMITLALMFNLSACFSKTQVNPTNEEVAVGAIAPEFNLVGHDQKNYKLSDYKGKYVVLEWLNFDCPFVQKHYHEAKANMQTLQANYTQKGVVWFSINSSAAGKQGHLDAKSANELKTKYKNAATAILLDAAGDVGRLYGAKVTPHMFIVAPDGKVIYRGAIDDKASTDIPDLLSAKNYVAAALDSHMKGEAVAISSSRAYGCSVKY
jgi:peroxiredoxin